MGPSENFFAASPTMYLHYMVYMSPAEWIKVANIYLNTIKRIQCFCICNPTIFALDTLGVELFFYP